MLAVIEELTRVGGHRLCGNSAALGTGESRVQFHHAPPSIRMSGASMKSQHAEIVTKTVATQRRTSVLFVGGGVTQVKSRAHAWRLRRCTIHPAATATIAAIVRGQWNGTKDERLAEPTPIAASPSGKMQQAAAENRAAMLAMVPSAATPRSAFVAMADPFSAPGRIVWSVLKVSSPIRFAAICIL